MKRRDNIICKSIKKGSIADKSGIKAGYKILTINSADINDVFDYDFYQSEENLTIKFIDIFNQQIEIVINKEQYEDLGIEFETYMMDCEKSCTNKCIFCFIDQLPDGMRESLYFKDDDTRLSFLTGSYVTLTNIDYEELQRVVRYKLSPINISIQTTNPELRVKMLNNRFAGDIMQKIKVLTEGNITVNCQIVLCKGINDGEELGRTLGDLLTLIPQINSISVVPVGITKFRDGLGLHQLEVYTKEDAADIIKMVEQWQEIFQNHMNKRVVFAADEIYVKAGIKVPDVDSYEDFPQLENGVGMLTLLEAEVDSELENCEINTKGRIGKMFFKAKPKPRNVTIATGECAFETIERLARKVMDKYNHLSVNVIAVKNTFFGPEVTVAGLITGKDLLEQLAGRADLGEAIYLSNDMFKDGDDMLLDDVSISDLESGLDIKVIKVYNSGSDFVKSLLNK